MNFINLDHPTTSLEDYDILAIIDRSDYSTVYKALDKRSGRIVALKMINIVDQKDITTLIQAMESKQVKWKHVCQVFNCFGEDGKVFIVMEFFAGGSIKDILGLIQKSDLQMELISIILKQLILAVIEVHSQNLIHRQIKCANILLSADGQVKLSYFAPDRQFSETLNKSKSHLVSLPYWLAPESIQNSQFDQKTDIWALGITAIELITGVHPFQSIPPQKAIFIIAYNQPPKLPSTYSQQIFDNLMEIYENIYIRECQDFVRICLQKDPKFRANAKQLLDHPLIRCAKKTQLLFELFEKRYILQQQTNEAVINYSSINESTEQAENKYMHKRVNTSFRINSNGVLIAEQQTNSQTDLMQRDNELVGGSTSNALNFIINHDIKEEENDSSDHHNQNKTINDDSSDSGQAFLVIKRTIRKIEKYKQGLTKIIFQEIIQAYNDIEPSDYKQYFQF